MLDSAPCIEGSPFHSIPHHCASLGTPHMDGTVGPSTCSNSSGYNDGEVLGWMDDNSSGQTTLLR